MAWETVNYDIKGHVARVALNRPETHNTMNTQLIRDLDAAMRQADAAGARQSEAGERRVPSRLRGRVLLPGQPHHPQSAHPHHCRIARPRRPGWPDDGADVRSGGSRREHAHLESLPASHRHRRRDHDAALGPRGAPHQGVALGRRPARRPRGAPAGDDQPAGAGWHPRSRMPAPGGAHRPDAAEWGREAAKHRAQGGFKAWLEFRDGPFKEQAKKQYS